MSDSSPPQKPIDPDTPNPKLIITENRGEPLPKTHPFPPAASKPSKPVIERRAEK